MMSGIRGKDTGIELRVRHHLHRSGYRYRLHANELPGRPDILLPRHRVAISINGCFWHRHECSLFKLPKTNAKYWDEKLNQNKARDKRNYRGLAQSGWRVLVVWECALRRARGYPSAEELVVEWVESGDDFGEVLERSESAVLVPASFV